MNGEFDQAVPLGAVSLMLVLVLLVAWLLGSFARWLLRGRARLGTAASVVMSILGAALGLLVVWLIRPQTHLTHPLAISSTALGSLLAIAAYAALAARFQPPRQPSVAELLAAGESDRVEFKSTARVNLRTGAKGRPVLRGAVTRRARTPSTATLPSPQWTPRRRPGHSAT